MKYFLSCLVLGLKFIENPLFCSYVDLIAYRFMLVFIMVISSQACLACKSFLKSCPHDQFMLNYGLSTKLYIARISRTSSKSENPFLTRQVRSGAPPNKSGALGIPLDHFSTLTWTLFLPTPPTGGLGDSRAIWGPPPPPLLGIS
jgi:hypothetical protein